MTTVRERAKAGDAGNGANLGFEEKLWAAADKMRGHTDPAEYKHVALGLIFLKYISDAFEERYRQLSLWTEGQESDYYIKEAGERYLVLEDRDEYTADNIFWVPSEARWSYLQANAKQPTIGKLLDDVMVAIERENPSLKGVLPKDYARESLDKQRLGELVDLIGTLGLGDGASRSKDILGRVYEYFLSRFASAEGKGGGEVYTPQSVVKLLVETLERSIRQCQNRAIETAQVIAEPIDLAKEMRDAIQRGQDLGMSDEEIAFYDALAFNDSAVQVLGDETLRTIARELVRLIRQNATIDWTVRETTRAKLRSVVKRLLRKYGYPLDQQESATKTVLEQAELLCADWAA